MGPTLHGTTAPRPFRSEGLGRQGAEGLKPQGAEGPGAGGATAPGFQRAEALKSQGAAADLLSWEGDPTMHRLAVLNLKGGSAKTTTALALAFTLANRGHRTLVVDADSQANATLTLTEGQGAPPPTLGHVLLGQADAHDAIRSTRHPLVDVLGSDPQLADAAVLLAEQLGREHRLQDALDDVADDYEHVIVDCAPAMSLVAVNVLAAVEGVLVPVDPGLYSLAGLGRLQEVMDQVRRFLKNERLHLHGLVLTRTHRNKATADLEAQLRDLFGPLVCRSTIPHSVRVEEAVARHRSIVEWSPRSAPAAAYESLCSELFGHGQQSTRDADAALDLDPADDRDAA
jgi:chromosome partitioning protein